jgi:hypothetical protein
MDTASCGIEFLLWPEENSEAPVVQRHSYENLIPEK